MNVERSEQDAAPELRRQDWTVTAPDEVGWTPAELAQIGEAIRQFQTALPGAYPFVVLGGVRMLPTWVTDVQPCRPARTPVMLPPCPVCGKADWPEGGMHAARSIHLRAHERSNSSTVCVCGDMQAGAADPLTAGNVFAPHVDRKTGEPCPGIPTPQQAST